MNMSRDISSGVRPVAFSRYRSEGFRLSRNEAMLLSPCLTAYGEVSYTFLAKESMDSGGTYDVKW